MRRLERRALLTAGCGLMLAAASCTLFVPTEDLAGATSSLPDAGEPATDASEERTGEGAAPPSDASTGRSCDGTFCDDFDRTPLGSTWSKTLVDEGMELSLSPQALSAPFSLRARVAGPTSPEDHYATLERELGQGSRLRCELSFQIVKGPTSAFSDFIVLTTSAAEVPRYELRFSLSNEGRGGVRDDLFKADGGCDCPRAQKSLGILPPGVWTRLVLETDFTALSVWIDDALVTSGPFGAITPGGSIRVAIGVAAFYGESTTEVLFDDVSCTVAP